MANHVSPMRRFRGCCVLALALVLPASTMAAEIAWRHFSQLKVQPRGLPVFADLDGNGSDEIVFVAYGESAQWGVIPVLCVLGHENGRLALSASVPLPPYLYSMVAARRPGQGDTVLLTVQPLGPTRLMEFGGRGLDLVRDVIVQGANRLRQVADIDGDGKLEILADATGNGASGRLYVLDYATAAVEWQSDTFTAGAIAAQLDADPALEIISRGTVGRIYDGATHAEEWSSATGFGSAVVSGNFEADPLVPGFVANLPHFAGVFRGEPYAQLRGLLGVLFAVSAFDTDGDGRDELYATRQAPNQLLRVSVQDGQIQTLAELDFRATVPSLGRLLAGESPVAVLATEEFGLDQPGAMAVYDMGSGQFRFQADANQGPWWPSTFARPGAGGGRTAVSLITRHRTPGQYGIDLNLRDAEDGRLLATRNSVFSQSYAAEFLGVMADDIDGVGGDEFVVYQSGSAPAAVALLDGTTLQDRWRSTGFPNATDIRAATLADRNQDGIKDVVLAVGSPIGTQVRLMVLSGIDGDLLWQSVPIQASANTRLVGLVAGEVDAQAGAEIVVSLGDAVYAFDLNTGLTTWIVKPSDQRLFLDVVHWGSDDDCRIGLLVSGPSLQLLSCHDRALLGTVELPPGSRRVVPLDPLGRILGAATDSDLLVSAFGTPFEPVVSGLGGSVRLDWPWAVQHTPGAIGVLLGSSVQVLRLNLTIDPLFESGFDALP